MVITQTFGFDVVTGKFKGKSCLAHYETLLRIFCGISELQNVPLNDTTKNPKQRFLMSQSRFTLKLTTSTPNVCMITNIKHGM